MVDDPMFNEQDYLRKYPDIAKAIEDGHLLSGKQHYDMYGQAEGRQPYQFDARWYANTYPSAQEEVDAGAARTLKDHYEIVGRGRGWLPCAPATQVVDQTHAKLASLNRRLTPVLVTYIPRSGSTLLMNLLAANSDVAVAKHYPYEVRVATYYAHAAQILTAKGEVRQATEFMRNPISLPQNPFNHFEFSDSFTDVASFFDNHVEKTTREHFRRIAQDFYKLVAIDQDKPMARFFAEKCELNLRLRTVFRKQYPETKEIILVRDLRDIFCSYLSYFEKAGVEQAASLVANSGRTLLAIKKYGDSGILFGRYEDFIRKPERLQDVGSFLEIKLRKGRSDEQDHLFKRHATSASPLASIGQWRKARMSDKMATFRRVAGGMLDEFDAMFGYEP